jgi:hypothetical protein
VVSHISWPPFPDQDFNVHKFLLRLGCGLLTFATGAAGLSFRHTSKTPVTFGPPESTDVTEPGYRCDELPDLTLPLKVLLNRNYPGWEFPEVSDDDCYAVRECGGPQAYAQMIKGDFNDDGRLDYAVLIEQAAESDDRGVAKPLRVSIVVFFRTRTGYKMYPVTSEGGSALILMHKGTTDYDYEKQRDFTYPRDTIFSGVGMGGSSYLYEYGRFRAIITSD